MLSALGIMEARDLLGGYILEGSMLESRGIALSSKHSPYRYEAPCPIPQMLCKELCAMTHTYDHSTWKAEANRPPGLAGQPASIHGKLQTPERRVYTKYKVRALRWFSECEKNKLLQLSCDRHILPHLYSN